MISEEALTAVRGKPAEAQVDTDLELLAKVRAGDRTAFEQLYRLIILERMVREAVMRELVSRPITGKIVHFRG